MNLRSRSFLLGLAAGTAGAAALLLVAPIAAAAQTAEAPSAMETTFRWLNFVLVFGVGGWWAWGKVKGAFRRNAEKIAAAIGEAEMARQAAQARLQAAEAKLASVDREAGEMRERARRDSAAEALRIRELAREEAARIERAADAEIAAAELASAHRLREMAIDRTIEYACARISERLTPETAIHLVDRFVAAVGAAGGSL